MTGHAVVNDFAGSLRPEPGIVNGTERELVLPTRKSLSIRRASSQVRSQAVQVLRAVILHRSRDWMFVVRAGAHYDHPAVLLLSRC